jgi:toxin FitB
VIVLDTNVVSEPFRANPDANVMRWYANCTPSELFITATTVMELYAGMHLLPEGRQRLSLNKIIRDQTNLVYAGRILVFDTEAATTCGRILAESKRRGREPKISDCQIASIALKHNYSIATRNTKDFQHDGLRVINPWTD